MCRVTLCDERSGLVKNGATNPTVGVVSMRHDRRLRADTHRSIIKTLCTVFMIAFVFACCKCGRLFRRQNYR